MENQILSLFDDYFKTASREEIDRDVAYVESFGKAGISFEEYLEELNLATSIEFNSVSIPEDNSVYNKIIGNVTMDEIGILKEAPAFYKLPFDLNDLFSYAGESNYAMAA